MFSLKNVSFQSKAARLLLQAAAGLLCCAATMASAQNTYPDKPVKIIVGFAPGGTNDILARLFAAKLQEKFNQSFIVENKPGAASAIGNDAVAKSAPDGYTLLVSSSGGLTVNPVVYPKLGYDPVKDFAPIALLGSFPLVITTSLDVPANNLAEFIDYAKKNKNTPLSHGVATSAFELAAELFATTTGIKLNHIPYKGSGPVLVGLRGGEIQVGMLDSGAVMPHLKSGKLKALAVTSAKRSQALPDVPTVLEAGVKGFDVTIWTALMAPKATPEPILAKLRAATQEILKDKELVAKLNGLGMDPGHIDHTALSKTIVHDIAMWRAVAQTTKLKSE
jgi:tripartite-type tricarboxylate transporter receptor subunit TctC